MSLYSCIKFKHARGQKQLKLVKSPKVVMQFSLKRALDLKLKDLPLSPGGVF